MVERVQINRELIEVPASYNVICAVKHLTFNGLEGVLLQKFTAEMLMYS